MFHCSGKTYLIFFLWFLIVLSGCEEKKRDGVISKGETFIVSTDSITIEGVVFKPPFGILNVTDDEVDSLSASTDSFPSFKSSSPVIDALYANGVKELTEIQSNDFISERLGVTSTGEDVIYWMSLSLIDRDASMNLLRRKAKMLSRNEPSVFRSHMSWITAAWETYCVDGSIEWLKEIYPISSKLLQEETTIGYDRRMNLVKGGMELLDAGNDINVYPVWAGARDIYCTISLMNNLFYMNGLNLMSMIAERLGRKDVISDETALKEDMAHRMNRAFWTPEKNNYTDYLYAEPYFIQSPFTDNAASSLAVIFNVATPEMAALILNNTYHPETGMSVISPNRYTKGQTEKGGYSPMVNAMWGLAASFSGNENELAYAMGAVARGEINENKAGSNGAAMVMLALRGVAGIRVNADSLFFEPVVPDFFQDKITLKNIKYRNATLNVEIQGNGTVIESFTLDGERKKSNSITSEMAHGLHDVVIRMAKDDSKRNLKEITGRENEQLKAPSAPDIKWLTSQTGQFTGSTPPDNFIVYRNGVIDMEGSGKEVKLSNVKNFSEYCIVPVSKDGLKGFSAQPHYVYPKGSVMTLQAEEFYVPGTTLIKDKILSSRMVESAARKNRSLRFKVSLNKNEDVFLDVCYSNGNGKQFADSATVLREVWVNGKEAGTFFFAGRGDGWWLSTGMSNMVGCSLKEGENIIEIKTNRKLQKNKALLIDYLRIIKATPFTDKERNEKDRHIE